VQIYLSTNSVLALCVHTTLTKDSTFYDVVTSQPCCDPLLKTDTICNVSTNGRMQNTEASQAYIQYEQEQEAESVTVGDLYDSGDLRPKPIAPSRPAVDLSSPSDINAGVMARSTLKTCR